MNIKFKLTHPDAVLPEYAHPGDLGMDVYAVSVEYEEDTDTYVYHTGIAAESTVGSGILACARSSNCSQQCYLPNGVGVIWNKNFIVNHTKFNSNYLYFRDTEEDTLLSSDNTKFASIVFTYDGKLDGSEVFAIAANREYQYTEDDNLTRHIRVIETSELYDCRKMMMNVFIVLLQKVVVIVKHGIINPQMEN